MAGYEIKPTKWLSFDFKELWQFRELFFFMAWRDIKVKYKQTLLGFLWVILQPLILMLIFTVIWQNIIKLGTVEVAYPLFAYSGLIFWGLFSSGISSAGESMITNSNIIKKVYFPRIIIPASAIIIAFFDFLMTLVVYVLIIFYYDMQINILKFISFLSLSVLITLISAFGLGLIIASASIKYRDFRYIVPFFLQAFFFVSPVIVPLSLYGTGKLSFILSLNPLAGAINLSRSALTNNVVDWQGIIFSIVTSILLLFIGITFFRKTESQYADLL
jgi:lipopolysaccharide transport system permease protein